MWRHTQKTWRSLINYNEKHVWRYAQKKCYNESKFGAFLLAHSIYTDRQKKLKLETLMRNFLLLRRNYIKFGTHFSWHVGYLRWTNWECTKTGNKISLAVSNSPPDPKSSVSCMAASSCNGGSYSPSHRPCKSLDCNLVEISLFLCKCIMQLNPCLHVILGIHPPS